jgi:cytochrome c nitrite reductase small subunit
VGTFAGLNVPRLGFSLALGLLLGTGAVTLYTSEAASYLSDDPRACANCHVMRDHFDGWQKAGHHAYATCNDCHVPPSLIPKYLAKAENGYHHSKGFTLQDFHEPIRIKPRNKAVLNANCTRCHRDIVQEIIPHAGREEDRLDCVRCHASVGHGPVR